MREAVALGAAVIPVDKPVGPTSHDIVRLARRSLRTRRVGHTGTLDPFASGLLLLCTGWATRLSEYLTGLDKVYQGVARLGQVTDTADRMGSVTAEDEGWRGLGSSEIEGAFQAFVGEIDQVPPIYSAKKIGGVAAYERARRGEEVELKASRVRISRIEILDIDLPEITFEVSCSSGTYIRSLARDIGAHLGVGAHLRELRRTMVGRFGLDGALRPEDLEETELVMARSLTPLQAVGHLPRIDIGGVEARAVRDGVRIPAPAETPADTPLAIAWEDRLLAIGRTIGDEIHAGKVFAVD